MILVIDNYDSFTWNLVQRLWELDAELEIQVARNDRITPRDVETLAPTHLIISPGPCTPAEAGVSNEIIQRFAGATPILGVCLGHQCIGASSGMVVSRHPRLMHGKTSDIHHDGRGVFEGLPNPFTATRYHSLVIERETVHAPQWRVCAWTTDELPDGRTVEVVMGLRRVWDAPGKAPLEGVQFHPESFLTAQGPQLLANFLRLVAPTPA